MTLDNLRKTLKKMNLAVVSKETGLHHNTLLRIRNGQTAEPSYAVLTILFNYIESVFKGSKVDD